MFPLNRLNMIKKTFDPPTFSHGMSNSALTQHTMLWVTLTVVNTDCFNGYDPSILGNIDPDINNSPLIIW